MASFQLKKTTNGQFDFRLKADNGETILSSETYKAHASALNGIESVKKNAADAERFEKKSSTKDQPYFVLKAGNNEIIGSSEMYSSDSARDKGIVSVMKNAPSATTDDQSNA